MIPHKSQVSFRVVRGRSGLHSIYCRGFGLISQLGGTSWYFSSFGRDLGVPLELQQGPSRVSAGTLGFLWNCNRDLREPFVLSQGSQVSFRVLRGKSRLLSRCFREIGPHLALRGPSRGFFFFFSSCGGSMGFLSNCKEDLREPSMLPQGSQASFQVAKAPQDSS